MQIAVKESIDGQVLITLLRCRPLSLSGIAMFVRINLPMSIIYSSLLRLRGALVKLDSQWHYYGPMAPNMLIPLQVAKRSIEKQVPEGLLS